VAARAAVGAVRPTIAIAAGPGPTKAALPFGSIPSPGWGVATVAETTSRITATTLLVSVEPCSEPDIAPPRDLFGHHAAWQRGAMFPTRPRPERCVDPREHRSTLASSVVAKPQISWRIRSGLEHCPTLASSVVTQTRLPRKAASGAVM